MRGNTVELLMKDGEVNSTEPLYQWDYGQRLIITGVELPQAYEVHFSNDEYGNGKTMIGDETGVDIPDEYLTTGKTIFVWLFLHVGENDGETEYRGYIPVTDRAKPTDEKPTPEQQSVITQTIAALNAAVETAEGYASDAKDAAEEAQHTAETVLQEATATEEQTREIITEYEE